MGLRHFGIGAETTWDTSVTPTRFLEALTESVQKQIETDEIETIRNLSLRDRVLLNSAIRGSVEILANYDGVGILYEQLIGSVDTTTGSVNTHTFPANAGIGSADRIGKSLTIEMRRDSSLVWTYAGCKIVSLEHTFGTDQASRMTVDFLGGSETTGTSATTASFPTLLPVSPSHVTVSFDGTSLDARSATVRIENPLDEPFLLGSTSLAKEPDRAGVLRVTGSVEVLFDDFTQYTKFDGSTDVDVQIVATNTTESITYNMNKCRLSQATPAVEGRERLSATYEFESIYDTDATENVQIVLVNNDSTP